MAINRSGTPAEKSPAEKNDSGGRNGRKPATGRQEMRAVRLPDLP
jgi:hypothetical protein